MEVWHLGCSIFPITAPVRDLEDGDMLVLFSDGVTDAVNEADEDFGEDRLISIVSDRTSGLAG